MAMYLSSHCPARPAGLSALRRHLLPWGLFVALLTPVAVSSAAEADQAAAPAAAAGAKPAAKPVAKKPPPKKMPEWHGEAAPEERPRGERLKLALLDLGNQRMAAGRYEEAIKAYTDVADKDPLQPKPFYLRGVCYQKMGKLKEAEADFRQALSNDPKGNDENTFKVRAELGAVLTDTNRPSEAVQVLEQAIRDKPDLFEAVYNLGVAYEAVKDYPKAIGAYGRATKLKPDDNNPRASIADAYYNLGAVLRKSGRLEDAIAPTREAVQLASNKPETHLNLGLLLSEAKRFDEAVGEMTAAIQLADSQLRSAGTADEREEATQLLYRGWWRLGMVNVHREKPTEAITALEKAKSIRPTAEVMTDLGLARRKAGDVVRAEAEFRAALVKNPGLEVARLHLASTLVSTGRCPEGLAELPQIHEPAYTETVNRIKARCDWERQTNPQGPPRKK